MWVARDFIKAIYPLALDFCEMNMLPWEFTAASCFLVTTRKEIGVQAIGKVNTLHK